MASKASSQECGNPECNATSTPQVLLECARCDTVSYCSKECQIAAWPVHKPTCRRQNYIIKFHVAPDIITNPPVVRTLSCPADALFSHLDMALQVAFGWASTHSFHFAVSNPDFVLPSPEECDRIAHQMLRLRMMGLENDASMPREFLFRVVDPSMDVALLADRANQPYRSHPNTPEVGADDYKLYQLFDDPKYKDGNMSYAYDMGDWWDHSISIVGRAKATMEFMCLSGSGHPIAEDVGDPLRWEALKAAYRATIPNAEQLHGRYWYETHCSNGDPHGLAGEMAYEWDRDQVNRDLELQRLFDRFEHAVERSRALMEEDYSHDPPLGEFSPEETQWPEQI